MLIEALTCNLCSLHQAFSYFKLFDGLSVLFIAFICAFIHPPFYWYSLCVPLPPYATPHQSFWHDCFRSFGSHPTEQVLSDLHFLFFGAHIILIGDLNICFVHANEMSQRNSSHRRPTKGKAWTRIGKWEESYLMNGVPFERERSASGGVPRCGQNTPVAVCC